MAGGRAHCQPPAAWQEQGRPLAAGRAHRAGEVAGARKQSLRLGLPCQATGEDIYIPIIISACLCQVTLLEGREACEIKLTKPLKFYSGRADCIPDPAGQHGYQASKEEVNTLFE